MKVSGKMSVGRFEEEFMKEFGVKIEIKVGGEFADNKATLASLRPKDFKGPKKAEVGFSGKTLVKNVKRKINTYFGVDCDLYYEDKIAPDDITLASVRKGEIEVEQKEQNNKHAYVFLMQSGED